MPGDGFYRIKPNEKADAEEEYLNFLNQNKLSEITKKLLEREREEVYEVMAELVRSLHDKNGDLTEQFYDKCTYERLSKNKDSKKSSSSSQFLTGLEYNLLLQSAAQFGYTSLVAQFAFETAVLGEPLDLQTYSQCLTAFKQSCQDRAHMHANSSSDGRQNEFNRSDDKNHPTPAQADEDAQAADYMRLLMTKDLTNSDDIALANTLIEGAGAKKHVRNSAKMSTVAVEDSDDVTAEFVRRLDTKSAAIQPAISHSHDKDHAQYKRATQGASGQHASSALEGCSARMADTFQVTTIDGDQASEEVFTLEPFGQMDQAVKDALLKLGHM